MGNVLLMTTKNTITSNNNNNSNTHSTMNWRERVYIQHDTSLCHSGQFNASQKEIPTNLSTIERLMNNFSN